MKCFLHNGLSVWKVPRRVDQERASIIPPPDDKAVVLPLEKGEESIGKLAIIGLRWGLLA
jgi:hypothetical protein